MRILIVDDHAIVREGLKRILASEFTNASFGEAANTTEALAQLLEEPWELVLLDVSTAGAQWSRAVEGDARFHV